MRVLCGILALFLMIAEKAHAFSLLGPFDVYQTPDLGYNPISTVNADLGGPMNIGQEYRWNVQTITYGFDPTFVSFFGKKGVEEVNKAFAMLNALPKFSKMSSNLTEFPTDTVGENHRASVLGVADLKSVVLGYLMEELGLANPERFVWTLRDKIPIVGGGFDYQVIMRNLDPATGQYSRYVNGQLYSYIILDPVPGFAVDFADAVEVPLNPNSQGPTSVASMTSIYERALFDGQFFTGLTRDDIGGLRYLYTKKNQNVETLLPGSSVVLGGGEAYSSGGGGTNGTGTNTFVDIAWRPGVDKILFKEVKLDGQGLFQPVTNRYTDTYVVNGKALKQTVVRISTQPDILFKAEDLSRFRGSRTTTASWINNAVINSVGGTTAAGPGVIQPPIVITLNNVGISFENQWFGNTFFLDEGSGFQFQIWGSFDGTTNTPFIYPVDVHGNSYPIEDLEQHLFLNN